MNRGADAANAFRESVAAYLGCGCNAEAGVGYRNLASLANEKGDLREAREMLLQANNLEDSPGEEGDGGEEKDVRTSPKYRENVKSILAMYVADRGVTMKEEEFAKSSVLAVLEICLEDSHMHQWMIEELLLQDFLIPRRVTAGAIDALASVGKVEEVPYDPGPRFRLTSRRRLPDSPSV